MDSCWAGVAGSVELAVDSLAKTRNRRKKYLRSVYGIGVYWYLPWILILSKPVILRIIL